MYKGINALFFCQFFQKNNDVLIAEERDEMTTCSVRQIFMKGDTYAE
jgi:hypothetical protein